MDTNEIKLTETVKKGGCAAKLPAGQLKDILAGLKINTAKELLVGIENLDDAALWDLGDGRLMIQTLDFFTPIVNDAYQFGQIAAANSLSDVYAMGGEPKTALSILAFPASTLPLELITPLLEGALSVIHKSGAVLAGGHTIDDETLKLGFSVTGFVKKEKAWTNSKAQPGDVIILTKPLGTGTITSALKNGVAEEAWIDAAVLSMTTLNRAPELLTNITVNAATDITGFGLMGHSLQVARASHVSLSFNANSLPVLPGARECIEKEILNRAHRTNLDYVKDSVDWGKLNATQKWLSLDAQTSGGLLLCIPKSQSELALSQLRTQFPFACVIGEVLDDNKESLQKIQWSL
jgi:selenide,water dikinase